MWGTYGRNADGSLVLTYDSNQEKNKLVVPTKKLKKAKDLKETSTKPKMLSSQSKMMMELTNLDPDFKSHEDQDIPPLMDLPDRYSLISESKVAITNHFIQVDSRSVGLMFVQPLDFEFLPLNQEPHSMCDDQPVKVESPPVSSRSLSMFVEPVEVETPEKKRIRELIALKNSYIQRAHDLYHYIIKELHIDLWMDFESLKMRMDAEKTYQQPFPDVIFLKLEAFKEKYNHTDGFSKARELIKEMREYNEQLQTPVKECVNRNLRHN